MAGLVRLVLGEYFRDGPVRHLSFAGQSLAWKSGQRSQHLLTVITGSTDYLRLYSRHEQTVCVNDLIDSLPLLIFSLWS